MNANPNLVSSLFENSRCGEKFFAKQRTEIRQSSRTTCKSPCIYIVMYRHRGVIRIIISLPSVIFLIRIYIGVVLPAIHGRGSTGGTKVADESARRGEGRARGLPLSFQPSRAPFAAMTRVCVYFHKYNNLFLFASRARMDGCCNLDFVVFVVFVAVVEDRWVGRCKRRRKVR